MSGDCEWRSEAAVSQRVVFLEWDCGLWIVGVWVNYLRVESSVLDGRGLDGR